jgi:hypothetical protein
MRKIYDYAIRMLLNACLPCISYIYLQHKLKYNLIKHKNKLKY